MKASVTDTGSPATYRIFPKDKTVSVQELKEKLTPIIKELMIQGNKNMATVSFSAILRQAGLLKNLLEEWTSTADTVTVKADRAESKTARQAH